MKIFSSILVCVATAICAVTPQAAWSQTFPTKPVRVVVPFPPGGVDVTIRLIQKAMADDLGQPVVIENRPGANGFIGSEHVARSTPDGYTLLATSSGTLVSGPLVSTNVPFDVIKDFTPITMVVRTASTLVVKPSLPVTSIDELIDYAKRNPGKLAYASTGIGSVQHLDGENFKFTAGVNLNHIPYKGFGPVLQAVLAQEIDVAFITVQIASPFLSSGKARPLAVYNGTQIPGMPNVPELANAVPSFQATPGWIGLLGPAGLPRPIVARLNAAAVKALGPPELRSKLADVAVTVIADKPEEFAAKLKAGREGTAKVVNALKSIGVKFEE